MTRLTRRLTRFDAVSHTVERGVRRGGHVAQDMFDARLVVMDTDFRMFSFRQKGQLPGIDIATILDGSAYHTSNDNLARIRPGQLQVCPSVSDSVWLGLGPCPPT